MAETNSSTQKTCCACGESKELELFPKLSTGKFGRSTKCKVCVSIYLKQYRLDNIERLKAQAKQRYIDFKPENQAARREDYQKNKERYKLRAKEWASENKEKRKEIVSRYNNGDPVRRYEKNKRQRLNNPGYYAAAYKARQLRKKQAMPAWADVKSIEAMYRQSAWVSKITGIKHHVDHYYPLKSDMVCGLHNEFNLRIIPAKVNLRKHNHFPDQEAA